MDKTRTEHLAIEGMFCSHCEARVKEALVCLPGVQSVSVSFRSGRADVVCDETVQPDDLRLAIEGLGYEVGSSRSRSIQIASVLMILLSLYVIAKHLGWTNALNVFPAVEETMSLGMLFLVGVLTSVHCLAMCGGINLTQSAVSSQASRGTARSNLEYNIGRVISYTVIGGIAGGIGRAVSLTGALRGLVAILAGAVMLCMAMNMLGLSKWFRLPKIHLPHKLHTKLISVFGGRTSFGIGLLNGLMPCGPLQSMQIYALSTGSICRGMLAMLSFSLGTVPLMFGLGFVSGKLNRKYTRVMLTVSAMLIFVMGLHMVGNGLSLSGASPAIAGAGKGRTAVTVDDIQVVQTEVDYGSYEAITVKSGIPVQWVIHVPEGKLNGCNGEIIVPEYDLDIRMHEGDNPVEFTPSGVGTVSYRCWMGMIQSSITIVE